MTDDDTLLRRFVEAFAAFDDLRVGNMIPVDGDVAPVRDTSCSGCRQRVHSLTETTVRFERPKIGADQGGSAQFGEGCGADGWLAPLMALPHASGAWGIRAIAL